MIHVVSRTGLDDKHLVWKLSLDKSTIIDVTDGRLVYIYDPVTLTENDPRVSDNQYFRYEMSRGPAPGTITLFDGTAEARTLDLASGRLVSKTMDVSLPGKQFKLGFWWLLRQRLFFTSPNEVRVRPMP